MRMTKYGDARVSLLMISGALVAAMTPTAARADSATFATRADFEAAAGATRVVEFATDDAGNPITDPANDVPFQFLGLSGVCFQNVHSYWNRFIYARPHAAITVDLPSDTYAFGTLLSPFYVVDGTHTITLSTGEVFGSPDIKVGRSPGRSDQELCDLGRNRLIHGFFWDLPEQYFLASVDGRLRRPRSGWGACSAAAKSRRKVFNLWLLLDDRWAGDTAQVEPVR